MTLRYTGDQMSDKPDKPSYLSLLNAIALNEARAHRYLQVWIEKTDDPEVKAVLQKVSWR